MPLDNKLVITDSVEVAGMEEKNSNKAVGNFRFMPVMYLRGDFC